MTNRILFLGLVLFNGLLSLLMNELIMTDEVYSVYFQDQLSLSATSRILASRQQLQWIGYSIIPIIVFIKLAGVSVCLLIGTYLANVRSSIQSLFATALRAEYVLTLPSIVLLLWFGLIQTEYSLEDTQNLAPLSLANFFDPTALETWEKYILGTLNIFQILYILLLAYELAKTLKLGFHESLTVVFQSYLPALLIWTVTIAFLIISLG